MQCGFSKQMLATPLNGRVSERFNLIQMLLFPLGEEERKGSTCLLTGFSTGVCRAAVHMATGSLRASLCTR